jgi:hypothetical protein
VGPTAGLDAEAKGKILCLCRGGGNTKPTVCKMNVTAPSKYYREARELSETNINCLCTFLKNEVWSEVFCETDVNEKWEKFCCTFKYYFNRACPITKKKFSNAPNKKWVSNEVIVPSSKLKFLYNVYKETTTKANKQLYISYKRKYKNLVKMAKANFIYNTIASLTNISKTLWNMKNDERCNEGKKSINNLVLHHKDQKVMCPQRICNIFNSTFLDNVDKLVCNNHPAILTSNNITNNIMDSFYLPEVTEEDLLRIIGSLKSKKSTGIDGISPILLKRCVSFIIKPLLEIINIVIRTGTFPECSKRCGDTYPQERGDNGSK